MALSDQKMKPLRAPVRVLQCGIVKFPDWQVH